VPAKRSSGTAEWRRVRDIRGGEKARTEYSVKRRVELKEG
jgi:hypothetical protein